MAPEPPRTDDDLDTFDEAIEAFRRRVPISDREWDRLTVEAREYAFKVAGVAQADQVQRVYDAIDRAIKEGTTLQDFKAEAGDLTKSPAHAETVFRTNVLTAYNAGRHAIFSEPHVRKDRPYLRFDAVGDSRMTEVCEACDGIILPADHSFWLTFSPPLHYACRSVLVSLDQEEAEAEGISPGPPMTSARPQPGFGRPPSGIGRGWKPDLSRFSPAVQDVLAGKLADDD
jgi:SPP1 gp7 family putative phage head morphogenesis protein